MLERILNNLKKPHRIPLKIISKVNFYFKKKNYQKNFFEDEQNKILKEINLDRKIGLSKLLEIHNKYKFIRREMSSEHELLFSSLSLSRQVKVNKILEIGTHDGINAFLLSLLFQNATIETIDLEEDHPEFINFYGRKDKVEEFVSARNIMLGKNKKIIFKKMNSITLCNNNQKYDLIWIDGAHGYPVVCMDILNSLKLINDNGIIMCDDIYINKVASDGMYNSTAAFETLINLKNANLINFTLAYKRLDANSNCVVSTRKYVAFIKKI